FLAFISLGLPDSLFGVAWPLMHLELGVAEDLASYVTIIVGAGTMFMGFFAGKIIRKLGTGRTAAISTLLTAVAILGIGLSQNIWLLVAFSTILGLGAGAIDAGLNDYVARNYKAKYMSWLHCFWGVGVTVSPLIMSQFLANGSWRGGYITVSIIQMVLAVILFACIPVWTKVARVKAQNALISDERGTQFTSSGTQSESVARHKVSDILKLKGIFCALFTFAIYCAMEQIVGYWGASFLVNDRGISPAEASLWVSLYYGGIMLGRLLTGFLTAKFSDRQLTRYGVIISIAGIILLIFRAPTLTLIGLLLIGLGFAPVYPCGMHATPSRFGDSRSADAIGFQMGFAGIGMIVLQPLFGIVASNTTFAIFPYVLLAMGVLLFILTEFAGKRTSDAVKQYDLEMGKKQDEQRETTESKSESN
ncbi:MAG: MFS transporter, partial [Clostridia bacterium]